VTTPEVALARLAAWQHGVVTQRQLIAAGLDRDEVTAPSKHRLKGIHVHRSRHAEATTNYGIRVTTPSRTLVDLADVLAPKQLARAVNEAQVQRLVTAAELATLFTRYPGRRTSQLTPERGATRSPLEDRFVRFLKRHPIKDAQRLDTILRSRA
jgi:hypothetical protein